MGWGLQIVSGVNEARGHLVRRVARTVLVPVRFTFPIVLSLLMSVLCTVCIELKRSSRCPRQALFMLGTLLSVECNVFPCCAR